MLVFVVDLMIPVTEDYIPMTTWMTVSDDMRRTLTVAVLSWFQVKSQQLCERPRKSRKTPRCFCCYLKLDLIFPFEYQDSRPIVKSVIYTSNNIIQFACHSTAKFRSSGVLACSSRNGNNI